VTPELRDLAPTIEGVARLIAEEEDDIEWLAGGLRASIGLSKGIHLLRASSGLISASSPTWRVSRARLLKALKETLPSAAKTVDNMLRDWALCSFLADERLGLGFGPHDRGLSSACLMRSADGVPKQVSFQSLFPRMMSTRAPLLSHLPQGRRGGERRGSDGGERQRA
jgi:hypothetical protein